MNASTTPAVKPLIEAADRAHAAGRHQEAAQLLAQAQQHFPDHPLVLSAQGMHALQRADTNAAKECLQRAVSIDSKTPMLWLNLALAYRAANQSDAELQALQRALTLDPYFSLALLQKGRCLEKRGERKAAAQAFHGFLASLPAGAAHSPAFKSAVAHAQQTLKQINDELFAFIADKVAAVKSVHADAPQQRFDACMDILVGRKRVYVPQPTFMHFPHLPAVQFFDRAQFPWLAEVEAAADAIRRELLAVMAQDAQELTPYVQHPEGAPLNQWRELNNSLQWSAYYLWREGRAVQEHLARCPVTAEILARAPTPQIGGHAPTAFFSILKPRTHIPPHTGVTNTRSVVHLPLIVPEGCGFRVGYETRQWREGVAWVFDDTIEHEAWNNSDEMRAILIFDIWNPYLSAAECALVAAATEAVGEFHGDGSKFDL